MARSKRWRNARWRAEAALFDLFCGAFRLLPVGFASGLGAVLGVTLGPLMPHHRIARANIRLAFPEMSPPDRKRLLRAQWANIGRMFAEFAIVHRITPASGRVEVIGGDRFIEMSAKKPLIVIGSHFSNWEVMAKAAVDAGANLQITYRAVNNPYINQRIVEGRRRYGVRLLVPKGGDGSREILAAMGRGESIFLMNDQKFNDGLLAPFFGIPVATAPGPTRLALRFDTEMVPVTTQRTRGARFRVTVHDPIVIPRTGDRVADIQAGVEAVNRFVEARVRERPHEWFWVHRRWSDEAYQALGPEGV